MPARLKPSSQWDWTSSYFSKLFLPPHSPPSPVAWLCLASCPRSGSSGSARQHLRYPVCMWTACSPRPCKRCLLYTVLRQFLSIMQTDVPQLLMGPRLQLMANSHPPLRVAVVTPSHTAAAYVSFNYALPSCFRTQDINQRHLVATAVLPLWTYQEVNQPTLNWLSFCN